MSLTDSEQRQQATDPTQSFIVQAPAGSGKTEMLSQRFLRLLGIVTAPEQIVALTFTRKAAAEMRERIIKALQDAQRGKSANTPHQQQTLNYARAAMARSLEQQWHLLEQPWRLRIMTIDALCQQLCLAIPIQENAIAFAEVSEDAQKIYEQATRACLDSLKTNDEHRQLLRTLLIHLDNRMDSLIKLCCDLLAKREQWLPLVLEARTQSRDRLEQALHLVVQHEIERFYHLFPAEQRERCLQLAHRVAQVSDYTKYDLSCLLDWQEFSALNHTQALALSHLLLNASNELRNQYDQHIGVKKSALKAADYQQLKAESSMLQAQLKTIPGFCEHIVRLRGLPEPCYSDQQWAILSCLLELLLQLAIHLQDSFQQSHCVDFTAMAHQAVSALGNELSPTDLALYLDNRIHHLLVDEFQDTSQNQFALLSKLVMGWEPHDGRSLFLVGDPMQSIYRFRQAEVGLFIKAREEGIGAVALNALELRTNFRSTAKLVHWVNQQFCDIFPPFDDIEAGAIRYHPSTALHPDASDSFIQSLQLSDAQEEAEHIVRIIQREQAQNPRQSIAILVRSRGHLNHIMAQLRDAGLTFQGVDIDRLADLPHIQDVWSLTQILLYPANRLAWFSLLRSPFCGMPLDDLHALAKHYPDTPFLDILNDTRALPTILSPEGWQRFQSCTDILRHAVQQRHQHKLVPHLHHTLQWLGANRIYDNRQFAELEQYWLLLERFESDGVLRDPMAFQERLKALYSQVSSTAPLQIMTIHKSKGLEFDTVIIPHLGAKKKHPSPELIRWLNLPQRQEHALFLMAPLKAASQDKCRLYNFVQSIHEEKEAYELQRLLYVALTRAKKRLYLSDCHRSGHKGSLRSLMTQVQFSERMHKGSNTSGNLEKTATLPLMERLPLSKLPAAISHSTQLSPNRPFLHHSSENIAAILGTWTHTLLQWMSEQHVFTLTNLPWHWLDAEFKAIGWDSVLRQRALQQIESWIKGMLADPQGQWILKKHRVSLNELSILEKTSSQLLVKRIDRLFRDEQNRLWVVDFKTGHAEHDSPQHRQQVNDYARLLQELYQEPLYCGLYYLDTANWVSWTYPNGDL
ncbi:MAG: UvrD-helicase domain-containing protein [Legionellaceae bacterium]|nr:UvrD-helicase domain-containing protein [Legionellaceae bacterium]